MSKKVELQKDAPKSATKSALRLFGQLKNQKARLIVVLVCVVLYTILNVVTPYYSAIVIDSLLGTIESAVATNSAFVINWDPLGIQMTILFVMYLLTAGIYFIQSFLMASVAEKLILTLRVQISEKLNKLPLRFFDRNKPGEILSRVTSDLDRVSETMQTGLLRLITSIGTVLGSLAFMFAISWVLTLIFLGFAIISLIITSFVAKKNLICSSERQEAVSRLTGIAEEYYTGRDIIKAYNREEESKKTVSAYTEEVRLSARKTDFLTNSVLSLIHI